MRLYKQKPDLLKPDLCCEGKNKSNNAVRADRQDPDLAMAGKPKSGFGPGSSGKNRTYVSPVLAFTALKSG